MGPRDLLSLLKRTFQKWSKDKASRLAAALAYYTIFSLAPLLVVIVLLVGLLLGAEAARGQVATQLQGAVGPDTAKTLEGWVDAASSQRSGGLVASAFGLVALLLGAMGLFGALQGALNSVWGVEPKPGQGLLGLIKSQLFDRLQSFVVVLVIGLLLIASTVASAVLSAVAAFVGDILPGASMLWFTANILVSLAIITLLFTVMFKVLPDAAVRWSDVWVGSILTAVLFIIGRELISFYLSHASVGSIYGAAGSLVIVLVWIYYAAQIVLFGAEFTQVYATTFGSQRVPEPGAQVVEGGREAGPTAGGDANMSVGAARAASASTRSGGLTRLVGSAAPLLLALSLGLLLFRRRSD